MIVKRLDLWITAALIYNSQVEGLVSVSVVPFIFTIITITDTLEDSILIHGSLGSKQAQEKMEIFNAAIGVNQVITDSLPWDIGKLSVFSYSYCLDGDFFVVTGGREINSGNVTNSIEYINVTKIFTEPPNNETFEWDFSCITRYDAFGITVDLDDYLLEERDLRFEVLTVGSYRITVYGNGEISPLDFRFNRDYATSYVYMEYEWEIEHGAISYLFIPMKADIDTVSKLTNIDMTGNISVLWMAWNDQFWFVLYLHFRISGFFCFVTFLYTGEQDLVML